MEPEYDEKLVWVEPAPANPDDAARPRDQAADESPWGEGIKVDGDSRPLKGRLTPSLMADGYGFGPRKNSYGCRSIYVTMGTGSWSRLVIGASDPGRLWYIFISPTGRLGSRLGSRL